MKKLSVILFGLLLTGCAASSSDIAEDAELTEQEIVENKAGYKCKKERVTGSIMSKRRCTTRAQREESAQRAKEMMNSRKSNIGADIGG
ncbi:hypothetical protein [uncultured Ferrimonas sp.]|uniref:hypothetical protein n=1 Tax=uncultured Ferrimonas sp. TaxID=432640 RepID=UPI002638135F|nr:hypothetical protein [uncultured Ferrimonas sp.]